DHLVRGLGHVGQILLGEGHRAVIERNKGPRHLIASCPADPAAASHLNPRTTRPGSDTLPEEVLTRPRPPHAHVADIALTYRGLSARVRAPRRPPVPYETPSVGQSELTPRRSFTQLGVVWMRGLGLGAKSGV